VPLAFHSGRESWPLTSV